jgi:catalase (peroxidase I)
VPGDQRQQRFAPLNRWPDPIAAARDIRETFARMGMTRGNSDAAAGSHLSLTG